MVTNYAKRRVKLRIERAKFQFVLIVFCNRAVLLFNFLIKKKQWLLTKAITVKANFITQTKRIKRTTLRKLNQASPVFLNSFSYPLKIEFNRIENIIHRPWSVRIGKNCARGLEYGPRPQAAGLGPYSRPRAQFFPIRTDQGR